MEKSGKIYIAGHHGMVGSAIVRKLRDEGYENFIFRTSAELDLRSQQEVAAFFRKRNPDMYFLLPLKLAALCKQYLPG